MGEALVEHRDAGLTRVMRDAGQLVLIAAADESQPTHHIELFSMQKVQSKAPGLEDHVVAVVELVDVHRDPRNGGDDGRAHRRIEDHAVLPLATRGRNRYHRRGQIAEELVGRAGLEHTSRYMSLVGSLPARVLAHIRRHRLFPETGEALVAVSGGADSVALLDLLSGMVSDLG